jgi:hypothetical protein
MTALRSVPGGAPDAPIDGFEVAYTSQDGVEHRAALTDAWSVRFEMCLPARRFPSYKRQRNYPGRYWSATTGHHVGFESWLERDHVMLLDHDQDVVGIASQPFWLFWATPEGKTRSHAPDYFARHTNGGALVLDCRPTERIKPADAAKFDATRRACELVGWSYRVSGVLDAITVANVRWLAGYRHPRHYLPDVAEALLQTFADPLPLVSGAEAVGDPIAVLPVLFHLLWRHDLLAPLSTPLHADTTVTAAG